DSCTVDLQKVEPRHVRYRHDVSGIRQITRHFEPEALVTLREIAEKRAMGDRDTGQFDHDTRGVEAERDEHRGKVLAVIVLDALEQTLVHAQKKQSVLLRA